MLLAALLLSLPSAPPSAAPESIPLFQVVDQQGQLILETVRLQEGQVLELATGAGQEAVALVLPPASPGISGELVRADEARRLTVGLEAGELILSIEAEAGSWRELARVPVEELRRLDVRVSAVDAQGRSRSWLVRGWEQAVEDDVGPAMDLFAGMLPLQPGDLVLTTEAVRHPKVAVEGRAVLVDAGEHVAVAGRAWDDSEGWFLVDTSASTTVVARDFLAPDAPIEPATMVERSASGVRTLDAGMTGATGAVGGLLGQARLDPLTLGGIVFGQADVRVLEELPSFGGRRILGILGLDLLRRGGRVSIRWPRGDQAGELRLGAEEGAEEGAEGSAGIRVPLSLVSGIPFVRGELSGRTTRFAVDTGSRLVFVGRASAERMALELDEEGGISFRGLGAGADRAPRVREVEPSLGGRTIADLPVHAADLPVFARLARGCDVGVLGLPFLRSFEVVSLDLEAGELTLAP